MDSTIEKTEQEIKNLDYTELEDRLEMAQIANADTNRCCGSSSDTTKTQ